MLKGTRPDHRGPNGNTRITVLFRVDDPAQLRAMQVMAGSFGSRCQVEPVISNLLLALHILPGTKLEANTEVAA